MKVPVYKITVKHEEFGLITYKPFAVKGFDLKEFLSHQPSAELVSGSLIPDLEIVPDWIVPEGLEFVEV